MKENNLFELLAPAGSFQTFQAVIAAGADAVYVGGSMFGARAYADNFSEEELLKAIDYAHIRGRRVYLTVNTLLKNREIKESLYAYLLPYYEQGIDAVIVQDFGVMQYLKEVFPLLPIHTSTQMTVTGVDGAGLLAGLGAKRIVLSRELSLSEIKKIHETAGVELEAFVHGALCYSYSGQCLFSSLLGERSGNRGRCAQPCRLMYSVLDDKGRSISEQVYPLSLKDLCGIEHLQELCAAGVYSLKIEGRMKQAEYAAGVVSIYRKYIDLFEEAKKAIPVLKEDQKRLKDLGNRCGFTAGYFHKRNGTDMVTMQKPGYERQRGDGFAFSETKLPLEGYLLLKKGLPAEYRLRYKDTRVCVSGDVVDAAKNKPLVQEDVRARMEKTGDTPFFMQELAIELEEAVFVPNGALNQLRRDGIEALQREFSDAHRRPVPDPAGHKGVFPEQNPFTQEQEERIICLTEKRELLDVFINEPLVTDIYLDAGAYPKKDWNMAINEDISRCRNAGKRVYYAFPRIFRESSRLWYEESLKAFSSLPLDGVVVRNYESLGFVQKHFKGMRVILDQGMYTYNNYAIDAFLSMGIQGDTVPYELNRREISHRNNLVSEMVVYGYYPLMTSAQCIQYNLCRRHKETTCYLKDRYHKQFPVKCFCKDCYSVVYNSLPTLLFAKLPELKRAGIRSFRLDFTVEDKFSAQNLIRLFFEFRMGHRQDYPREWQERYTNGHYQRGVE